MTTWQVKVLHGQVLRRCEVFNAWVKPDFCRRQKKGVSSERIYYKKESKGIPHLTSEDIKLRIQKCQECEAGT